MRAIVLAVLAATAAPVVGATLEDLRIQATLSSTSSRDPFRIHGRLSGVDASDVAAGPLFLRFASIEADIPAGAFRRRHSTFTWKSFSVGVKKVTVNVKKATIDIVGGGAELGDLSGPVTLAFATPKSVVCGHVVWNGATAAARGGRRTNKKIATGPLAACVAAPDGADHRPPQLIITSPTLASGTTTTVSTVSLAGVVTDDVGVAGLTWANDQGGGASFAASTSWTIADVPLVPGDNRITVTATDSSGNSASDTLVVTYNTNGIVFAGMPTVDPDAFFRGDLTRGSVFQAIAANLDLDPASVELDQLADDGTATPLGALLDDGSQDAGDLVAGDGIYTGPIKLRADTDAPTRLRVAARTLSQPGVTAWSSILEIPTIEHVAPGDLDAAIGLATDARTLFDNLVAGGTASGDAVADMVALAYAHGATVAGPSDGGLGAWWLDEHGLLGGVLGYDQTTRRGGGRPSDPAPVRARPLVRPHALPASDPVEVGTRRTLVLAPYFADAEPAQVGAMYHDSLCPEIRVDTRTGTDAGAENFKNLDTYGVVLIASHGDTLFDALGDAYRPEWNWSASGAQTVVLTGTVLDSTNRILWESDLRLGRMAVFAGGVAGILPGFVSRYSVRMPASLVYVGSCRSSANPTLSSALLDAGAATVFGYDGYVSSAFANATGVDLFTKLLQGADVSGAFTPGAHDDGSPPANFTLAGRSDMTFAGLTLVNGSFEIASGVESDLAGYSVMGDVHAVGALGSTLPTDGQRMAMLETGVPSASHSGTLSQEICVPLLPPGATKIMLYYDWNFFSEKFLEGCGGQSQDAFLVKLGPAELQTTTIDDLCGSVTPSDVSFDQGDVYSTGWIAQAIDITVYKGGTLDLTFATQGDTSAETAVLVDHVRIVVE
jgi:hypothetical protein